MEVYWNDYNYSFRRLLCARQRIKNIRLYNVILKNLLLIDMYKCILRNLLLIDIRIWWSKIGCYKT